MHRLVDIKRSDLRCHRCGAVAQVGFGNSAVVATGFVAPSRGRGRGGDVAVFSNRQAFVQACEECLAYWHDQHTCREAAVGA